MLEKLSNEEFDEFSKNSEYGSFFQSSYWSEFEKNNGFTSHIIGIKEGYNIKGATLLVAKKIPILNKYIFYAPRGYLLNYKDEKFLKDFTKKVIKYVKKNNGFLIKINPNIIYQLRDNDGNIVENSFNNQNIIEYLKKIGYKHKGFTITYDEYLQTRWLSVLDIKEKSIEDIFNDMDDTTKSCIRKTYKSGLKLVQIDKSRIKEYKELTKHTSERKGFIDEPLEYYEKMYDCFKDNIKILLVEMNLSENLNNLNNLLQEVTLKLDKSEKENEIKEYQNQLNSINNKISESNELLKKYGNKIIVAGGIFITFGKQIVSLYNVSYKEFMKYNGQYFLNYEMLKYAVYNKYDKFDLFEITGNFNKDSEMYGLFNFKKGFGTNVIELIGEFDIVVNRLFNLLYKIIFRKKDR